MRLAFAGTPKFAALALESILAAGHQVGLVLTQPDRPAGRGLVLQQSAVKELALARGLRVLQPQSLRNAEARGAFIDEVVDVLVVAAYGLILPPEVLAWPRLGCLNIHASLLPRWRGAAPIQRALLAGDRQTGVCIMQMDAGLDTGPVFCNEVTPIEADDTAGSLNDRLAAIGARLIVQVLADIELGRAPVPRAQPSEGATYANKIVSTDARIDWQQPATSVERRLHAMDPAPGASTTLDGKPFKIWRGKALEGSASPGLLDVRGPGQLVVGCGEGVLRIDELQPAGGKRMSAQAFIAGRKPGAGKTFV